MKLDDFEKDILESVENGEWVSKGNIAERKEELKSYLKKKRAISIRVNEADIYEIKRKALENGVPYQNLIQMLIHQYAQNKISLGI